MGRIRCIIKPIDRTTAIHYAKKLSKTFNSEIRLTEGIFKNKWEHIFTNKQNL